MHANLVYNLCVGRIQLCREKEIPNQTRLLFGNSRLRRRT